MSTPPLNTLQGLPGATAYIQGSSSSSQGGASAAIQLSSPSAGSVPLVQVQLDDAPTFQTPQKLDFSGAAVAQGIAGEAASQANNFVAELGQLAASLNPPTINPAFPAIPDSPNLTAIQVPILVPVSYDAPQVPASFGQALTVSAAFPEFSASPPSLLFPNAPIAPSLVVPDAPNVDLNFVYPTVDVTLPDVPQLLSLSIQPFDGVTFPTLSATAPVLTAIPPTLRDYQPLPPYTDALLQTLTSTLKQRLDIGNTGKNTGLPPIIEENLWNREREREYRQQADALAGLDRLETMGYALPSGVWLDAQIKIQTDSMATIAGSSREIAAKQADLEQNNIKMALENSISIEGKLIDYANQTEQRRFDAFKYMTQAGIDLYNARVQAFAQIVQVYRAQIDVYQAQIAGARTEVEIYQAEIAAEKLKVDINTALVEQYKVRVDAALASIQVFEGEIQLVKTRAEVEQLKVSIFGEEVRAYSAQAQLFQTNVEAYKALVEAEDAKEKVYATQAQVYGSLVDATAKQIDSQIAVFKAQLEEKNLEVETYKAQVQSEAERVRALAAQDSTTAQIYATRVQGHSAYNSALIERYKAVTTIAEQIVQVGVAAAEANGKLYLSAASIASDAAKVGAQVEAQIAASALGTVTFATHQSRQDSVGQSQSQSFGNSKSISQSSSTNMGVSTSISYSTSASVSASSAGSSSTSVNIAEAQ